MFVNGYCSSLWVHCLNMYILRFVGVTCLHSSGLVSVLYRAAVSWEEKDSSQLFKTVETSELADCRVFSPLLKQMCWHPVYISWDDYLKCRWMSYPTHWNLSWLWFFCPLTCVQIKAGPRWERGHCGTQGCCARASAEGCRRATKRLKRLGGWLQIKLGENQILRTRRARNPFGKRRAIFRCEEDVVVNVWSKGSTFQCHSTVTRVRSKVWPGGGPRGPHLLRPRLSNADSRRRAFIGG